MKLVGVNSIAGMIILRLRIYVRIDDAFRDANEDLLYHCALIAKNGNPYLREVGLAFLDLMLDFKAGK